VVNDALRERETYLIATEKPCELSSSRCRSFRGPLQLFISCLCNSNRCCSRLDFEVTGINEMVERLVAPPRDSRGWSRRCYSDKLPHVGNVAAAATSVRSALEAEEVKLLRLRMFPQAEDRR